MINTIRKKKLVVATVLCLLAATQIGRRRRQYKTRPINRRRRESNHFNYYLQLKQNDPDQFWKYTRMTRDSFTKLLSMVSPLIRTQKRKDGICAEQKLIITLQ